MGMPQKRPRMHDGHTRLYRRMKLKRKTLDLDQVSKRSNKFWPSCSSFYYCFLDQNLRINNEITL